MIAFWRGLLDLALPRLCAGCTRALESSETTLCSSCAERLPWLDAEACARCQEALVAAAGEICPACDAEPSALRACIAGVSYAGDVEAWVHRFKYPSRGVSGLDPRPEAVLRMLVREAAERVGGEPPELVVPIPLHRRRLRGRGFNPAAVLAREVAGSAGSRLAAGVLLRERDTPSQTGLDRGQRRRNVAGAFRCTCAVPPRVWLVDDVVTTGSTLAEAARTLQRAGAHEVSAICVARTSASR